MYEGVYYSDYLQLDKILGAQALESDTSDRVHAHDEMLFIIIHQSYELWFKQILYEVGSVIDILAQPQIADNAPDLYTAHHRLKRVVTILSVLVDKITVLETMTPLDFLDFRDMLRPASGFQSMQFKILEARLGLRMPNRHGKEYYISQLKPEDAQKILNLEHEKTLLNLVNEWLERMPFFDQSDYWQGWESRDGLSPFWAAYTDRYRDSLGKAEMANFARYEELFFTSETKAEWALSPRARRAALFIMLYRDYPLLQLPFNLINVLLEIDEGLATWRYRHLNMVQRIIGARMGTGGSSGAGYLRGAMERHYVFGEFAELTSFLIERTKLPKLTPALCDRLGFR